MTGSQPELDGLAAMRPDASRMEQAAHQLLEQLREKGLLLPEHVLLEQAVVDLARAVGIAANQGKAAGMAMAAKELREFLALLPKANDDAFQQLMDEIKQAQEQEQGA